MSNRRTVGGPRRPAPGRPYDEGNTMTPSPHSHATLRDDRRLPTVSIVLPALNEEHNLPLVLEGLPDLVDEVIVVDGGSVDDTVAIAREVRPDAVVVRQTRTGKGNALVCGL